MTSNGPYYQSVPAQDHQLDKDDFALSQNLMQYTQSTTYPEPLTDYSQQQQHSSEAAQLHDLVEAATSAAAQERARQEQYAQYHPADGTAHHDHVQHVQPELDTHSPLASVPEEQTLAELLRNGVTSGTKRKHSSSPNQEDAQQQGQSAASTRPKRQKKTGGTGHSANDSNIGSAYIPVDSPHHLEARAAGVHSAAALFRPASEKSQKYTRPPMSKLFNSLELSPENFLYLQAAAKKFMLDPEHPERQECVGNRDKADHDMVKLKMINTVRTFLKDEGNGEQYFGVNAPPPGDGESGTPGLQRRWVWPRDETKIITLCTPLLRRMLTNERQRQYASVTRKPGKTGKESKRTEETDEPQPEDVQSFPGNPYDPRLGYAPSVQIYLLDGQTGQPVCERFDIPLDNSVNWVSLGDRIDRQYIEANENAQATTDGTVGNIAEKLDIRVLISSGLMYVSDEEDWRHAIEDVHQTVWLEGLVKVVVHTKPPTSDTPEAMPQDQP